MIGLFGGGPSKKQIKGLVKDLEKTKRRISLRCPKCGRVSNTNVYGSGSFRGKCSCGYNLTERDCY